MVDVSGTINDLKSIITFCVWVGGTGLCLLLVMGAVLRWLAPKNTRAGRLNWLACFAVTVLGFMGLLWGTLSHMLEPGTDSSVEEVMATPNAEIFTDLFSLITKLLLLGTVMASAVVLVLVMVLFLGHGLKAIFAAGTQQTKSLKNELKDISSRLDIIMKSPILIAIITWGILMLFVTLPFLMGSSEKGDLAETWKDGVHEIVSFGRDSYDTEPTLDTSGQDTEGTEKSDPGQAQDGSQETQDSDKGDDEKPFYQTLISYILLVVIVLGVAFATFKLLYSIILRTFTMERADDLIDEYSGAIGVLSVGVAMLWTLQGDVDVWKDPSKLTWKFLQAFAIVMVIVALIILTLEIIRLLLDMREKLIRQEARFVFVALVGQTALLLLSAMNAVYDAVNHAMGNPNNSPLERAMELIREKIVWTMEKHVSGPREYKRTFSGFSETVFKDDGKEEYW